MKHQIKIFVNFESKNDVKFKAFIKACAKNFEKD
jgi:hypothetical protein